MPIKQRESSVTVKSDWVVIEEMEKTQIAKLSLPTVTKPMLAPANIFLMENFIHGPMLHVAGRRSDGPLHVRIDGALREGLRSHQREERAAAEAH